MFHVACPAGRIEVACERPSRNQSESHVTRAETASATFTLAYRTASIYTHCVTAEYLRIEGARAPRISALAAGMGAGEQLT